MISRAKIKLANGQHYLVMGDTILKLTEQEGKMGNCHPENTNVDRGEAEVDISFEG